MENNPWWGGMMQKVAATMLNVIIFIQEHLQYFSSLTQKKIYQWFQFIHIIFYIRL